MFKHFQAAMPAHFTAAPCPHVTTALLPSKVFGLKAYRTQTISVLFFFFKNRNSPK